MCDIYMDRCVCGRVEVEMHLGDFNTPSGDISISCVKCDGIQQLRLAKTPRAVYWLDRISGLVSIYFLSQVALDNWAVNHPNEDHMLISKVVFD